MAIKIKFNNENRAIPPTLVLATRSGHKLGCIPIQHIVLHGSLSNGYELSCTVSKYDNWEKVELWDMLEDFKLAWSPEWDIWFELDVTTNEADDTVKNVTATSIGEAELSQVMLYNIEINTENDIDREDYKPTIIYDIKDYNSSLLDRIMDKAPHYKIRHVDASIAKLQRTFTFDGKSLRDALLEICKEVNALLVIHSGTDANGKIERAFSIYDLEEHCPNCGYRGAQENGKCPECGKADWSFGYGDDTGIFVSSENLADDITYETAKDSVKNCFRLVAGDDLMTAAVAAANPNGTGYLWYISDKAREDMSPALRNRLKQYDDLYKSIQDSSYSLTGQAIKNYNALAAKYNRKQIETVEKFAGVLDAYYDAIDFELYLEHGLLPDVTPAVTSAADEMKKLIANVSSVSVRTLSTLSSTTATSYVSQAARSIVDPRYSVSTKDETLNGNVWSGSFVITRYSDEKDTLTSASVSVTLDEDYENYVRRQIDRVLNTTEFEDLDIVALFKKNGTEFASEIKKYSLSMLKSFYDSCQACLNVLVEHNSANESIWAQIYHDLYEPYYAKLGYLQVEISVRESEIVMIQAAQSEVEGIITSMQDRLDFEKFIGEDLWLEFAAYRREDIYQNDNYVSDGLDNAALVENAREFLKTAQEEIERSATLQHSISANLSNLLVMDEFKGLTDKFELGNWLRIRVDGTIYILRLIDYEIDYDNLESLSVEYSDVVMSQNSANDIKSVLDSASSMSSSYGSVSRQAKHGDNSNRQLNKWVTEGLEATKVRFMSDAENQNITWDENGMLFRKWDDVTSSYEPTQLRIINSTIAVTNDNWKTVKTAVGGFDYKDPVSGEIKHGYGINAELLIGRLILGEELGLYNESNSLTFDRNGLKVSNSVNSFEVNPNGDTLFSVTCGDDKVIWLDEDGGLHIRPTEFSLTTGETLQDIIDEAKKSKNLQIILTNEYEGVPTDSDGHYTGNLSVKTGVLVFYGQVKVTNDCTYSTTNSEGVKGNWNSTAHEYTITELSTDSGYVEITATYKDMFTVTKQFNVTKVKAGVNGSDGLPGKDGVNGQTSYFHVKYSAFEHPTDESQIKETPDIYIGTYVDFNYLDSNDPEDYTWSRFQGEDGIPGTNGTNGETSYLHIKYSNDGGKTFTNKDGEEPGDYLGQYVDNKKEDSLNVKEYTWSKIKGDKGTEGTPGEDGKTSYFHVKYSAIPNPQRPEDMLETPAEYIGTYVDFNIIDSDNPSMYKWTKFQGTDGVPGTNGADGRTSYLHIKYSNDGGQTFTPNDGEDPGKYIGQYVDFEQKDDNDVLRYKWSKIEGDDGRDGKDGIAGKDGEDGRTSYFHVKYANSSHPSAEEITDDPTDAEYIGTYVDFQYEDSNDPETYTWTRYRGTDGIPGTNGENGKTSYLHIKYSDDGGQTFTKNNGEDVGEYIGQYVDFEEKDKDTPSSYRWSKIKGKDGIDGTDGRDAVSYFIETDVDIIKRNSDGSLSPNIINAYSYCRMGAETEKTPYSAYFTVLVSTDGVTFSASSIGGFDTHKMESRTLEIPAGTPISTEIVAVRFIIAEKTDVTKIEDALDMKTIFVLQDGKDGTEMTREEIFNKLTNNGEDEGIYLEDGHLYLNASYIHSGTISGDYIMGGTIEGSVLNGGQVSGGTISGTIISGSTISGGTISGAIIKSESSGSQLWNIYSENYLDTYSMYCMVNGAMILGGTTSDTSYATNNLASIAFNFPFTESPYMHYYALGIRSNNAICLHTPTMYVLNHEEAENSIFDKGCTGTLIVQALNPYTGQYVMRQIQFNKGLMVTQI